MSYLTIRLSRFSLLLTLLAGMLAIAACGGGGGGESASIGQFIDSFVQGVHYESISYQGTTDAEGNFQYKPGEETTFSIGSVILGTAIGGSIITPFDLVPGATDESDPDVLNICRFLQSLDEDGDPSNGIVITPEVAAELEGVTMDFNKSEMQEVLSSLDTPQQLVSEEDAHNHFSEFLGTVDTDDDGYTDDEDCNDIDPDINPGAEDIACDGIDQDCSGSDAINDTCIDVDEDGYTADVDCNDSDSGINPGAEDTVCDGIDQDCDEVYSKDDTCIDNDNDGSMADDDCDDNDADRYPGAEDIPCDGIDQNCDDVDATNATCTDADDDGYTADIDCNDNNETIYPGAEDIVCDGIDQDCNDINAKDDTCIDNDSDGSTADSDCDDNNANRFPGNTEVCGDSIDQDCNGSDQLCPDDIDNDSDGFTENQGDCDDTDVSRFPGNAEICGDDIDQDCSGDDLLCGVKITVGGTVLDTNGNPMAGVTISIGGIMGTTNSAGQYMFKNVFIPEDAPTCQSVVVSAPTGYLGATLLVCPEAQIDGLVAPIYGGDVVNPITTFIDGMYMEAPTAILPQLNVTVTGILKDCNGTSLITSNEVYLDLVAVEEFLGEPFSNIDKVLYETAFYLDTTAGDGIFSFVEVPVDSVLRLSVDGHVVSTISQNAFDCTGQTVEFCNDPVGLFSTINESPLDLGDVTACLLSPGLDDPCHPDLSVCTVGTCVETEPDTYFCVL